MDEGPGYDLGVPGRRELADRFLVGLCKGLVRVFFRRIEVALLASPPPDGPLIVVANHGNTLMDAVVLVAVLPVMPRFLAKASLWQAAAGRWLMELAGAIPVHRRQEAGGDPDRNVAAFAASHSLLAAGGCLALFPEGVSHAGPSLLPLKTGAARIALEAEAAANREALASGRAPRPLGVRIVPVGLDFEQRDRFRSRALVVLGAPIRAVAEGTAPPDPQEREPVRELTERIETGLRAVTINYPSWREARLLERAVDVLAAGAAPGAAARDDAALADRFPLRQAVTAGFGELAASHPAELAAAVRATRRYDRLLAVLRLDDARVQEAPRLAAAAVSRSVGLLAAALPIAVLGLALNGLPYNLPRWVVRALQVKVEWRATWKLLLSLAILPATWGGEAWLAARLAGPAIGWMTLLVAPLSGWFALRFGERWEDLEEQLRAGLVLGSDRRIAAELAARRAEVVRQVELLAGLLAASRT